MTFNLLISLLLLTGIFCLKLFSTDTGSCLSQTHFSFIVWCGDSTDNTVENSSVFSLI